MCQASRSEVCFKLFYVECLIESNGDDVRADFLDRVEQVPVAADDGVVYGLERLDNLEAHGFRSDGLVLSGADRVVVGDYDYELVSESPRLLQVGDVSRVDEVEDA